jgi:hypothetical protein
MHEALPEREKIKVAFAYNHAFFLGGGEISLSELIRALNKSLFEPVVLVPSSGEIEAFFEKQKVEVLVTPFPPLKHMVARPFSSFGRLFASLKNTKPNLIHANGSRVCFYSVLVGRLLGIPVIWHVRETLKDLFFYDAFLAWLLRVLCASPRALLPNDLEDSALCSKRKSTLFIMASIPQGWCGMNKEGAK